MYGNGSARQIMISEKRPPMSSRSPLGDAGQKIRQPASSLAELALPIRAVSEHVPKPQIGCQTLWSLP